MKTRGNAAIGMEASDDPPELANRPRYLLIDDNADRAKQFKEHTARFIRGVLLDTQIQPITNKYATVFVGQNYHNENPKAFAGYKGEIVILEDFRDWIDWLACAYYGETHGCRRINPKPKPEDVIADLQSQIVALKKKLTKKGAKK